MRMLGEKENNDVEVTWEDQQNINKFSRLHATFTDIEEEIQVRRREREDLDDLSMELELMDEDATVMYQVGEAYVDMPQSDALVSSRKIRSAQTMSWSGYRHVWTSARRA